MSTSSQESADTATTPRMFRRDALIALLLATVAAFASYQGAQRIDPILLHTLSEDTWFESDMGRAFHDMTSRRGEHQRAAVHPLFSSMSIPAVKAFERFAGLPSRTAVQTVIALVAWLWVVALYALLRLAGLRMPDTVLFTVLAASSAAAMFWFTVPETYPFGSLAIIAAVLLAALAQHRGVGAFWHVLVGAATLGTTVTNWMAAIAASYATIGWRRALHICAYVLVAVTLLWGVQKYLMPHTPFFIGSKEELRYVGKREAGTPLDKATVFLSHGVIMPEIRTIEHAQRTDWPILTVQRSAPWSGGAVATVGAALWWLLLAAGAWGMLVSRGNSRLKLALALTLAGQFCLHLVYGRETFLYALHYVPLLVLVAAFGTQTRLRVPVLLLAIGVIACAVPNNLRRFDTALALVADNRNPRSDVLMEMARRPHDPWPRGTGHVLLAWPGSIETDKSFHEPGGSFSPTVGSFGVSFWMTNEDGVVRATSDDLPLDALEQRLEWTPASPLPSIVTEAPDYRAVWTRERPQRWRLDLDYWGDDDARLAVAIRSVGPAAGPIRELAWDGARLAVNGRWRISPERVPAAVRLGDERRDGLLADAAPAAQWIGKDGWGLARLELGGRGHWTFHIERTDIGAGEVAPIPPVRSALKLDLPDPRFAASLDAQVAHLLMSLVGDETRGADPVNTPVAWHRDGAYVVVALARAGHLDTARELARYLAEKDFAGGFGAEADAPGLAVWSLVEVARHLRDPAFERWLWPHVLRKAQLILTMQSASAPVRARGDTPIVPHLRGRDDAELVAEAARDGLIVGRMDQHRPLLYVNAVSYRGLIDAAWLAQRLGHAAEAQAWRAHAADLQRAWVAAFRPPESRNERTGISALWPTWVAASAMEQVRSELRARWLDIRDSGGGFRELPLWTYFDVAEAHQWLFLGRADRARATVEWFWNHQVSPGLYTWWEDKGESNSYRRWNQVRGWVAPPNSTPHYWTAAEMLLLQLDMLAYVDESGMEPVLVVGAGIERPWLEQPMSVQGLQTSLGRIDWRWDGREITVTVDGLPRMLPVRLGQAFAPDTSVRVVFTAGSQSWHLSAALPRH